MQKRAVPFRDYFLLDVNPVIRFLTLSDIVWISGMGLLGPIFALFIVEFIEGGNAAVAGAAATIYLVTKSIFQMPIASALDRIRGEKDDFWVMFFGSLGMVLMPILYLFTHTPLQLYVVQFLYGTVAACTFPAFMAIFTRHIDKTKEGTEWGIYFTLTDLSSAMAASVGGILASTVGFHYVIGAVVILGCLGVLLLFPIRPYIWKQNEKR